MSQKLADKVAVITGASSGIGLATAKQFVNEGAYVFITGRRQNELDAAVKEIGQNVTGIQGDVAKLAEAILGEHAPEDRARTQSRQDHAAGNGPGAKLMRGFWRLYRVGGKAREQLFHHTHGPFGFA